eukprot:GHVN01034593.1.p2 GENE.GHVN01034593.1~~GHVN01034593.1.p2  ORF type:complete len:662 (+),score=142.88 GHVN01034593.1:5850-7835(+)
MSTRRREKVKRRRLFSSSAPSDRQRSDVRPSLRSESDVSPCSPGSSHLTNRAASSPHSHGEDDSPPLSPTRGPIADLSPIHTSPLLHSHFKPSVSPALPLAEVRGLGESKVREERTKVTGKQNEAEDGYSRTPKLRSEDEAELLLSQPQKGTMIPVPPMFKHQRKLQVWWGSAEMQGARPAMEDQHKILHPFEKFEDREGGVSHTLGYFAVMDGHNGGLCAEYLARQLHNTIRNNLNRSISASPPLSHPPSTLSASSTIPLTASSRPSYQEAIDVFSDSLDTSSPPEPHNYPVHMDRVFIESFNQAEGEMSRQKGCQLGGSTALVCMTDFQEPLTPPFAKHPYTSAALHIANVGDCRAIMGTVCPRPSDLASAEKLIKQSRPSASWMEKCMEWAGAGTSPNVRDRCGGGMSALSRVSVEEETDIGKAVNELKAVRLTADHKPHREDEKRRIERLGGKIRHVGCFRVGVPGHPQWLAVSRSMGDFSLKEAKAGVLIAEPECTSRRLDPDNDQFIVVACDGVWDVMTDAEVVRSVGFSLFSKEAVMGGSAYPPLSYQSGEPLLERGSKLRRGSPSVGCESPFNLQAKYSKRGPSGELSTAVVEPEWGWGPERLDEKSDALAQLLSSRTRCSHLNEVALDLLNKCMKNRAMDNLTAVVLRLKWT